MHALQTARTLAAPRSAAPRATPPTPRRAARMTVPLPRRAVTTAAITVKNLDAAFVAPTPVKGEKVSGERECVLSGEAGGAQCVLGRRVGGGSTHLRRAPVRLRTQKTPPRPVPSPSPLARLPPMR